METAARSNHVIARRGREPLSDEGFGGREKVLTEGAASCGRLPTPRCMHRPWANFGEATRLARSGRDWKLFRARDRR